LTIALPGAIVGASKTGVQSMKYDKHRTHEKEIVDGVRLENALKVVADWHRVNARAVYECSDWGSHVTQSQKDQYLEKRLVYASEVQTGTAKMSFDLWQRVNTELTGKCVGFLS
jgi:hypothetical protein